jgi:hypothetical protein
MVILSQIIAKTQTQIIETANAQQLTHAKAPRREGDRKRITATNMKITKS